MAEEKKPRSDEPEIVTSVNIGVMEPKPSRPVGPFGRLGGKQSQQRSFSTGTPHGLTIVPEASRRSTAIRTQRSRAARKRLRRQESIRRKKSPARKRELEE